MAFQVRIRTNKNTSNVLSVASSSEEFEKFTIGKLKENALCLFPGVHDPERLRVIFGQQELEDDQTFKSCKIEHLSLLVIVLVMPRGRGGVGSSDRWKIGRRRAESRAHNDYKSLSAAAGSLSITDYEKSRKPSTPSDDNMRSRTEEIAYALPAGASAVPSDPDMCFVLNLLGPLKRMDLRHREHTKLRIQQLVFDTEFNDSSSPEQGIRKNNSSERFRPDF